MIRIAIVGTGAMAKQHAIALKKHDDCAIVAACDLDAGRLDAFCKEHEIPAGHQDLDRMLAAEPLDAVVNVTPDRHHKPVSLKALAAGKHVLCEKPLAENHADASEMARAARTAGVVNMVNFSYRNAPAIQMAAELVRAGELGEIRHVEASYLQSWLTSAHWCDWKTSDQWLWRLSSDHGSKGVLGDLGVHIVDFASFPVGEICAVNCRLKTFDKAPDGRIRDYRLDANDSAVMTVEFANGALGTIHTSRWTTGFKNSLKLLVCGTTGALRVDLDQSQTSLEVCLGADVESVEWQSRHCDPTPDNWQRFLESIRTGNPDQPDFARGAAIQNVLDACELSHAQSRTVAV